MKHNKNINEKNEKYWEYKRNCAVLNVLLLLGLGLFILDGSLYALCIKIGEYVNLGGKYIFLIVGVLQLLLSLLGIINLCYAQVEYSRHQK